MSISVNDNMYNYLTQTAQNANNSASAGAVNSAVKNLSENSTEEEMKQAIKDFESYFVEQVMKEIKKSTDDLNGDDDSDTYAKQVSDMNMDINISMDFPTKYLNILQKLKKCLGIELLEIIKISEYIRDSQQINYYH